MGTCLASEEPMPSLDIEGRCFLNDARDGPLPSSLDETGAALSTDSCNQLRWWEDQVLTEVRAADPRWDADESVYVGGPGIAFALVKAGKVRGGDPRLFEEAAAFLDPARKKLARMVDRDPGLACSLMCGTAGWLCVDALRWCAVEDFSRAKGAAAEYARLAKIALSQDLGDDEWLYGRAGYLCGLLILYQALGASVIPEDTVLSVAEMMLERGKAKASRLGIDWPVMWTWFGKPYLGAAHGVAGILFMLLHVGPLTTQHRWRGQLKQTLDKLVALRAENGNWPGMLGEKQSKLVHFCHGVPGFVWLLCKAHAVFEDPQYLQYARAAGETVWRYGLLRKGPGLCHGIAGNGYALLALFRATGDAVWLERAFYFASKMFCPDVVAACTGPDHPLSLYEGKAGTLCFLLDLRTAPARACLPLFDLGSSAAVIASAV